MYIKFVFSLLCLVLYSSICVLFLFSLFFHIGLFVPIFYLSILHVWSFFLQLLLAVQLAVLLVLLAVLLAGLITDPPRCNSKALDSPYFLPTFPLH